MNSARWLIFLLLAVFPATTQGGNGSGLDRTLGKQVYERDCAVCHGVDGDGAGEAADRFAVKPRDFRAGVYKFRSTGTGKLPTDIDLKRDVVDGLPGTAMVPQGHLTDEEVTAVIDYLKAFSSRFAERGAGKVLKLPEQVPKTEAILTRGREVYLEAGCDVCHGDLGLGDGSSATDLSVPPTDLTRRPLKGGSTPLDILRAVVTGVDGTPMPSYHLLLDDTDLWALAYYVDSLGGSPEVTADELVGWEVEGREPSPRALPRLEKAH